MEEPGEKLVTFIYLCPGIGYEVLAKSTRELIISVFFKVLGFRLKKLHFHTSDFFVK